jgi:retron-type reverse transcriptase
MLSISAEKIHDNRFLRLLRNMRQAGYLEDWTWNATLSGAPQGSCTSPVLSNIYLHRLDTFVETVLIPEYTRGGRRARNPAYLEEANALARARRAGDRWLSEGLVIISRAHIGDHNRRCIIKISRGPINPPVGRTKDSYSAGRPELRAKNQHRVTC